MNSGTGGSQIWSFVPLLFMGLIFGLVLMPMAKRKGRNRWLWFVAGFVPGWNFLGGLWLASLPDVAIMEQVSILINEFKKFNFQSKDKGSPSSIAIEEKWNCPCGKVNNMNVPNCPECGLKRDFLLKTKKL